MECTEKKEQRKYVLSNDEWYALVLAALDLDPASDWNATETENMNRREGGQVIIVVERIIP